MKVVKDLNITGVHPSNGCMCAHGFDKVKGPWYHHIFNNCNCNCVSGATHFNANYHRAERK